MVDPQQVVRPLSVFFSYSHEDQALRDELQKHLSALQRTGLVRTWHDRRIVPGTDWKNEIDKELEEADIILLLISADFLASDYCYNIEMKKALDRHKRGEAHVIPVILRAVDFAGTPFSNLQALPPSGLPVTDPGWNSSDAAFEQIASNIRQIIESSLLRRVSEYRASTRATLIPQTRVLDAAIAKEIPLGESREVVVMVRLDASEGLRFVFEEDLRRAREGETRSFIPLSTDVRSAAFTLEFPVSESGVMRTPRIELRINAPDFEPAEASKAIIIPTLRDSPHHSFLLRTNREGEHVLYVELWCEEAAVVGQLLRTQAGHHGGPKDKPPGGGTPLALAASVPLRVKCVAKAASGIAGL